MQAALYRLRSLHEIINIVGVSRWLTPRGYKRQKGQPAARPHNVASTDGDPGLKSVATAPGQVAIELKAAR